jgi:AcrR family transcriptional regulator
VAEHGLTSVTMSQIAEQAGIARATLYRYFSDVEAIVVAWHERQISRHRHHLAEIRDRAGDPARRLEAVLTAYAACDRTAEWRRAGRKAPAGNSRRPRSTYVLV